jgi:hypothetical protein
VCARSHVEDLFLTHDDTKDLVVKQDLVNESSLTTYRPSFEDVSAFCRNIRHGFLSNHSRIICVRVQKCKIDITV